MHAIVNHTRAGQTFKGIEKESDELYNYKSSYILGYSLPGRNTYNLKQLSKRVIFLN